MDWRWVTLAVVSDILVYVWHGVRWGLLLKPLAHIPLPTSVRAIYVGLFANEVLPFRTGEVIRCYLLARWIPLPLTVTLTSALIERIFDGIWLIVGLFISVKFVPLPGYLVKSGYGLAGVLLVAMLIVGLAMFYKRQAHIALSGSKWLNQFIVLIENLHIMGNSRYIYVSLLASLPYLLIQVIPIFALLRGYGIDLSLAQATVLMIILRLSAVVPQAPGNLGTFQAFTVIGLQLFAIDTALAKRFSLVMWSVITLPLLIAGFIALAITGLKFRDIRRDASSGLQPAPDPAPRSNI